MEAATGSQIHFSHFDCVCVCFAVGFVCGGSVGSGDSSPIFGNFAENSAHKNSE